MVSVPVRNHVNRFLDGLQGSDPVSPLTVVVDVVQVIVHQSFAVAAFPSQILHYIDPLCQLVIADRVTKERIIGQDRYGVCETAFDLAFLGHFQKLLHILDRYLRRCFRQRCVKSVLCRRT